jgi:uncharacterized membrane protein
MSSPAALAGRVVWITWSLLVLQQAADLWMRQAPWIIWLALMLPLVIFVPGMLRDNLRSYIWVCFVSLLYFMRLVLALFARPDDWLAITGMVAVVLLFISAMLYVRWRARELRAAERGPSES